MRTVTIKKKANCEAGKFYNSTKTWERFDSTVCVRDTNGKVLAILLKKIITDPKLIESGRQLHVFKAETNIRADASGTRLKKLVNGKTVIRGKAVSSSMVGFAPESNFQPCRATAMFRREYDHFRESTAPLITYISNQFRRSCPEQWQIQKRFVSGLHPMMRLGKSVYTTLTVNCDFRTSAHRDSGDHDSGLGNLLVFNNPKHPEGFTGGELLLPEFRVAFNVQEGDILFMDVHQLHCNNPIQGKGRISLVCYALKNIEKCSRRLSQKRLFNPLSREFSNLRSARSRLAASRRRSSRVRRTRRKST
ncbi:Thymine dioxygenase jbp1 [Rhizophlyctis rosea]|nr:Thymine dioxygenase jbp1 [Rhizophlyctis rosea]